MLDAWPFNKRNRSALRALSVILGAALMLSQVLVVLHFALVPHRICAIHGLEEAPVVEATQWVAQRAGRRGNAATPNQSSDDGHERCTLASRLHERLSLVRSASIAYAAAPSAARAPDLARVVSPGPSRALYLLAPKHGPPA